MRRRRMVMMMMRRRRTTTMTPMMTPMMMTTRATTLRMTTPRMRIDWLFFHEGGWRDVRRIAWRVGDEVYFHSTTRE